MLFVFLITPNEPVNLKAELQYIIFILFSNSFYQQFHKKIIIYYGLREYLMLRRHEL